MKESLLIKNIDIYCPSEIIKNGSILINDGIISEISNYEIKSSSIIIDGKGKLLLPGFIDIHCNGGGGSMTIDNNLESIKKIVEAHARFGTTGVVLTTISVEESVLLNCIALIVKMSNKNVNGSKILGIHLEGPFLSIEKRGAHHKQFLKKIDRHFFDKVNEISEGKLKIFSLAPELDGALDLIEYIHKKGIVVGLAHSEATYEQTSNAIKKGLNLCVHLFNGMTAFSHKETGPIGAFLTTKNTFIEIISDGVHVLPPALDVVYKAKGANEIIIITDAVSPAGTDMKSFSILSKEIEVRGNSCYILNTNNLAGTALTMNMALKKFVESTSCTLHEAIKMTSLNPAKLLKIDNQKGSIEIGKDADLVLVDNNFEVYRTIIEGKTIYIK